MKRLEICRLSDLEEGDRFYFYLKKKNVCEFQSIKVLTIYEKSYLYYNEQRKTITQNSDAKVVFLRNVKPKT